MAHPSETHSKVYDDFERYGIPRSLQTAIARRYLAAHPELGLCLGPQDVVVFGTPLLPQGRNSSEALKCALKDVDGKLFLAVGGLKDTEEDLANAMIEARVRGAVDCDMCLDLVLFPPDPKATKQLYGQLYSNLVSATQSI